MWSLSPSTWAYSPLGVWRQTRTLLGQNVLLLFPYFMLHVLVRGEQMCSGGVDQVLGRAKQSAARWPGRRGGVSECGIVSPPHQGPRRHVERMQPSASAWMARQSRAQPHIWPGRRSLHYTPSDSPFQPGSPGAELTGLLTQAAWGVLTGGQGRRLSSVPYLHPSAPPPAFSSLCPLDGLHVNRSPCPGTPFHRGPPPTPLQKQVLQELTSPEWISPGPRLTKRAGRCNLNEWVKSPVVGRQCCGKRQRAGCSGCSVWPGAAHCPSLGLVAHEVPRRQELSGRASSVGSQADEALSSGPLPLTVWSLEMSVNITLELVSNAEPQAPPWPSESEPVSSPDDSHEHSSLILLGWGVSWAPPKCPQMNQRCRSHALCIIRMMKLGPTRQ